MNLNSFFQISVSVFCIVGMIFMICLFIWAVILRSRISKLITKLEEITATTETVVGEFKDFIERTIASLEKFKKGILTFEFIRKLTSEIISLIKNKKGE